MIAVWGPKGAPGRTSVAIELAAELAANHEDTLLVDADSYGGDILQLLGIVDELPTIVWAARSALNEEFDAARLAIDLRRAGRAGPVVLPGLPRADLWADVSPSGWRRLLDLARIAFQHTVCDVGFCLEPDLSPYAADGGRNRIALETIEAADHLVAVCRADPIGIKNFLWAYETLRDVVDPDGVVIVVNRTGKSDEHEIGDLVKRHTRRRATIFLPNRPQLFTSATLAGTSVRELDPGSEIAAGMRTLASAVGGRVKADSLVARFGGRR